MDFVLWMIEPPLLTTRDVKSVERPKFTLAITPIKMFMAHICRVKPYSGLSCPTKKTKGVLEDSQTSI